MIYKRTWFRWSAIGLALTLLILGGLDFMGIINLRSFWSRVVKKCTIEERVAQFGAPVRERLAPAFEAAGVAYPAKELAFLVFKDSFLLQVYGRDEAAQPWQLIKVYPVLAMSGGPGPKLKEGDRQVPEGIYAAEFLNPNSRFHLSIRLNYPNAFDRGMAEREGRKDLGSDIMIHGSNASIGCIAVGDEAAEDLFILAAMSGKEAVSILVSPTDLRRTRTTPDLPQLPWTKELYTLLREALAAFPVTP
jgi:hypothetical protein